MEILGGTRSGHVAWQRWLSYPGQYNGCLVPPDPATMPNLVVRVPDPPLLLSDTPIEERVLFVLHTYENACRTKNFMPAHNTKKSIHKLKIYMDLVVACRYMTDEQIPPATWIGFSLDFWNRFAAEQAGADLPPLRWTFSANRLQERGDNMQHFNPLVLGKIITGSCFKIFTEKHRKMRDLLENEARDKRQASEIANMLLPVDYWEKLIRAIHKEVNLLQIELDQALKSGGYLWV